MAVRFSISGHMLERLGSFDLSSFWKTPAAIWRERNGPDGTTTS